MTKDLSAYNVPANCCYSCPFGGKTPIELPPDGATRPASYDSHIITTNSSMVAPSIYAIAQRKPSAEAGVLSNSDGFMPSV